MGVMSRLVLSDAHWDRMSGLIIGRPDQKGSTGRDNRMFVEGVLWIVRTGSPWRDLPEAFGEWNERCARDHAELFSSAQSILAEVVDFVTQKTKAQLIYHSQGLEGLRAESEQEMDRIVEFIEGTRAKEPRFNYQRNTIYLRFCHAEYHKGAALAELARLIDVPRENIFAAGDHHNDISMLDGQVAAMPACPANAIAEVKATVRDAGGYVAQHQHGAGVHEALQFFLNGKSN